MSGALGITSLSAIGLSVAVYALGARVLWQRHPTTGRASAVLAALVLFPVFCVLIWNALFRLTTSEGTGVTPEVANRAAGAVEIPSSARDVNYRSSIFEPVLFRADFTISEPEFLKWARSQGWQVTEADEYLTEPGLDGMAIERGYSCRVPGAAPDAGTSIVFDADSSRAFVIRTTY